MDLFVHDIGFQWGGAEVVFESLARLNPHGRGLLVAGNRLQAEDRLQRPVEILAPYASNNMLARALTPWFAHRLPTRHPLPGRVTVSSFAFARWIPTEQPKLVYCHSPLRQIWHGASDASKGYSLQALGIRSMGERIRQVDISSTNPRDVYISPSYKAAVLLKDIYGINVRHVVPPPVRDLFYSSAPFKPQPSKGADFVWVGRIVEPIKRLDWLISVFRARPSWRLTIIGDGRDGQELKRLSPDNVRFLGWCDEMTTAREIRLAKALLLPSREDFGLAAAEALALGTPVVVTTDAGIHAWVRDGINGFVAEPSFTSFLRAVDEAQTAIFDSEQVRDTAEAFSQENFELGVRRAMGDLGWLN